MEVRQNPVVVDTSVVSILFRRDSLAPFYEAQLASKRLSICFQTLEEVWHGAAYDGWGDRRRRELEQHLERYAVIWPDDEIVHLCAELRAKRKKKGRELDSADAWIAATALSLGCPLVADDRDFVGIEDLDLIRAPGSPALLPPEPPGRPGAG